MSGKSSFSTASQFSIDSFNSLIANSHTSIHSEKDAPKTNYSTKVSALKIVNSGSKSLPGVYTKIFLDPLKNLITKSDYNKLLKSWDSDQQGNLGNGPLHDWLASISQRSARFQVASTHAFEEVVADLYDGFLSMEEGKRIKLPDQETVSPLVVWGHPEDGPYTWPSDVGLHLGIRMSTVNLPPSYSENIALWSSIGHETGGHDILHAYTGMLDELGGKVAANLLKDDSLKGNVAVNGRTQPLAKYAADYWKNRIDETASDVCGLLNIGPGAGISLALLLISLEGGSLSNVTTYDDPHPIDALRIFLAADVIRNTNDLDANMANAWADNFENIANKYIQKKDGFYLASQTPDGKCYANVIMPFDQMRQTTKTVAQTIASSELATLGGHSLSEVNTWADSDESLTSRILNDLLKGSEPSVLPGSDGQIVYAAHVLAAATIALAKSPDISKITKLAVASLNKLYDKNPVWHGIPLFFRSVFSHHNMLPRNPEFSDDLKPL